MENKHIKTNDLIFTFKIVINSLSIYSKMVIKSLKVSIYKILRNQFKLCDLSKPIEQDLRVPIKKFFQNFSFNYEIDLTTLTLIQRKRDWLSHVVLFILVSNVIRFLVYTFLNSKDIHGGLLILTHEFAAQVCCSEFRNANEHHECNVYNLLNKFKINLLIWCDIQF